MKEYIEAFVHDELGEDYLKKDYKIMENTCKYDNDNGVILILSMECDVREHLKEIAKETNREIVIVSVGLNENEARLEETIVKCMRSEKQWLLIHNIHLLSEEHLQHLSHLIISHCHGHNSKLVLTSTPHHNIPQSLLRYGQYTPMYVHCTYSTLSNVTLL